MSDHAQKMIDRSIGLTSVDLKDFDDLSTVPAWMASDYPACKISDLKENVQTAMKNLDAAMKKLQAFEVLLNAKPMDDLVVLAFEDVIKKSFLFEDGECGSGLGWLLKVAFEEYDAGNHAAINRYIEAAAFLREAYISDDTHNISHPHNLLSDVFDAYAKLAEEFVKGRVSAFKTYDDFIAQLERAPVPQGIQ